MRLRNIPGSREAIAESIYCINEPADYKGCFHTVFPESCRSNPIHMEIGMGKGRFIMDMARLNPDVNYIGVELMSPVLFRAIQKMEADPLDNVRFMRQDALNLCDFFAPGEIARIYLNFSDPWPKDRHAKRRLTSDRFLPIYHTILAEGGQIEFKTDNRDLFDFSVESFENSEYFDLTAKTYDLHNDAVMNEGNVMTEYEERFSSQGNAICKLVAKRK